MSSSADLVPWSRESASSRIGGNRQGQHPLDIDRNGKDRNGKYRDRNQDPGFLVPLQLAQSFAPEMQHPSTSA